ncbi:MAG: NifU family protein, partial [Nanoarchaeota archaeon]|nr:NifU family protein [Nanoarchaeota archaeon]
MSQDIAQIKEILEKEVKPMLAMHLGSLDFVGFKEGVVSVRFQGTCKGCPLSNLTLKAGIESILK